MILETYTIPKDDWEHWRRLVNTWRDPPRGLVALIAWESKVGEVKEVGVWDNLRAIENFYMDRIRPVMVSELEPPWEPERRGGPLAIYLRGGWTKRAGKI